MKPVDLPAHTMDGHLARNAIELAGAAEHDDVVVTTLEITLDPDVAFAADPAVQANERMALDLAMLRLEPALTAVATDPAAAVVGVKKLVLEDKRVLAHVMTRSIKPLLPQPNGPGATSAFA